MELKILNQLEYNAKITPAELAVFTGKDEQASASSTRPEG
jgi:DNA-binding Lrp family transcriptional regulator